MPSAQADTGQGGRHTECACYYNAARERLRRKARRRPIRPRAASGNRTSTSAQTAGGPASRQETAGAAKKAKRCSSLACASQRASLPTAWSIIPHVLLAAWTLEAPASWGNVAGNASPRRSLRQVRRKASLQTHRRPGNLASLDAIASVCAAVERTGRQFTPVESGQGGNLRHSRVDRASICVGPKAPSSRSPAQDGASTVTLAKRASGPYRLSAKQMRSRTGGQGRPKAEGVEKKRRSAIQRAYRSLKRGP